MAEAWKKCAVPRLNGPARSIQLAKMSYEKLGPRVDAVEGPERLSEVRMLPTLQGLTGSCISSNL